MICPTSGRKCECVSNSIRNRQCISRAVTTLARLQSCERSGNLAKMERGIERRLEEQK